MVYAARAMEKGNFRKPLALLFGLFVLLVAVVAKIPTSHCHCHDSGRTEQQRAECPFGQLRALAAVILPAAPLSFAGLILLLCGIGTTLAITRAYSRTVEHVQARAPPSHSIH